MTVGVADGFTPPEDGAPITVPIATIPTPEGDLSSHFALKKLRGHAGEIVMESVTLDDVDNMLPATCQYVRNIKRF